MSHCVRQHRPQIGPPLPLRVRCAGTVPRPKGPPHWSVRPSLPILGAALAAAGTTSTILGLPAVMPQLAEAFRISYGQAGFLVTAIWIPHALSQVLAGWAGEVVGVRRSLCCILAAMSALLAASLLAPGYSMLVVLRAFTGVATGAGFILAILFVAVYSDPSKQQACQSAVGAAAYLGCAAAYVLIALVQGVVGWRAGYLPSIVFVVAAFGLVAAAPRPAADAEPAAPLRAGEMLSIVWTARLPVLALAYLCSFGVFVVVASWLTTYLAREAGLGATGSLYVGAAVLAAGAAGRFAGSAVPRRMSGRALVRTGLTASGAALAGLALWPGFSGAPVLACMTLASCSLVYGSVVALAVGARPPGEAGAAVAWMLLLSNLAGSALPTAVGWLVDRTGSFGPGFVLLAGLTFAAVCLLPLYPEVAVPANVVRALGPSTAGAETAAAR